MGNQGEPTGHWLTICGHDEAAKRRLL